jgi:outer membrane protein OmpA-like peptidoglycan-associated protein
MLNGIKFASLGDNCNEWFSLGKKGAQERLVDSIDRINKILQNVGDLPGDPLQGNPYTIVNSKVLQEIFLKPGRNVMESASPGSLVKSSTKFFRKLSDEEWLKLAKNIAGTLIDKPITFGVGQSEIPEEFQILVQDAVYKLAHYPNHRIVIEAYVSAGEDPTTDQELSEQRALTIKSFLVKECNVMEERIWARGLGSTNPPGMFPDESIQAWKRRCRRAKIYLAQE